MSEVVEKTADTAALEATEAAAGLAAGFAKVRGTPTEAKTDTQAVTDEAAATAASEAKQADEAAAKAAAEEAEKAREKAYFESLPASVRAKLDKIDKIDKIEATANQIGSTQRKLKTVEDRIEVMGKAGTEAAKAATASGGAAPTQAQIDAAAAAGGEKWKQMQEDFPDLAEAMDERLAALAPGKAPVDVDALRREVAGEVSTRIAESVDVAEERAFIRLKHPGWKAMVNTSEFKDWTLAGGPSMESYTQYKNLEQSDPAKAQDVKAGFERDFPKWWGEKGSAIFSSSADDAVRLLDGFEGHRKAAATAAAAKARQEKRLEAAVAPKGSGAPPAPQNQDANALKNGWNKARGVRA